MGRIINISKGVDGLMKIKPLGSRVLLKEIESEETTKSVIVLPSNDKEKSYIAEVIEVGPGEIGKDGKEVKIETKKGDKVLYSKYSGTEVKLDNEEYLIVKYDDILAILQ
jgi:chaperonin GroES